MKNDPTNERDEKRPLIKWHYMNIDDELSPDYSSNVHSFAYLLGNEVLLVRYRKKGTTELSLYAYFSVSVETYDWLTRAPSKGIFLARFIKWTKPYRKIEIPQEQSKEKDELEREQLLDVLRASIKGLRAK